MIHLSVSLWFSKLSLWHMQISHQTWRLLVAPFFILQHPPSAKWQRWDRPRRAAVATVYVKRLYRTGCCHSFIFHKWINAAADHPPCPSKTRASYPHSFLQHYMKHARPCWFDFIRFPCVDVRKKRSASVFSLPPWTPLCRSCSAIAE